MSRWVVVLQVADGFELDKSYHSIKDNGYDYCVGCAEIKVRFINTNKTDPEEISKMVKSKFLENDLYPGDVFIEAHSYCIDDHEWVDI